MKIDFIPLMALHLSNFDHHVCKILVEFLKDFKFDLLPSTEQRYISLSVGVPFKTFPIQQRGYEKFESIAAFGLSDSWGTL